MCVCSLSYPARNAHAFSFIPSLLSLVLLYIYTLSHKTAQLSGKKLLKLNSFFYFLYNVFLKDFSFKEKLSEMQGDQQVSVHLMITIQKVTNTVQNVPRQPPDIY
jgi:hypothetical protein